ncbi:MAG: dinitrogenase iron-molybdenum cofactor biosynthesis protein [Proteobacteria bacterium]|nr:dinitrogenase iron-molybdenum cofactor biosynthesis protein [Pseudomonadota bacterium]
MNQQVAPGHVKEVAARIGLAARSLGGCDLARLIEGLLERLGSPLTTDKLNTVTVADLIRVFAESRDAPTKEEIKQAVRYLGGEGSEVTDLPAVQPYSEGELPHSVRLAVASNTSENLDGHFGSCKRFLVYQVTQTEARLIEIRDPAACQEAEDPNAARAQMLADCQLLYVQSIGGPAAAKVIRAGIHPVKFPNGGAALGAIEQLQKTLLAPPPWLARAIGVKSSLASRFVLSEE